MNHPTSDNRDLPDRLLAAAVRLLPRHRQDWARAMRAELAAVASPAERWRFAMGCARTAVTRPSALARIGAWILATAVVVWALILANNIGQAAVRVDAFAMVLVLTGVSWISRSRFLFGSSGQRPAPAILVMTLAAVTATRSIASRGTSSGRQAVIAGLWSLTVTASLVGLAIDNLLPEFSGWVRHSSPPAHTVAVSPATRLVDSIAVWLLGMLCAIALVIAIRPGQRIWRYRQRPRRPAARAQTTERNFGLS